MDKVILTIEELYNVSYVGFYDIKANTQPMWVFYQENPRTDLGHSNYMGLIFKATENQPWYVTNAKAIVDAVYPAIQLDDGRFIVSRSRHDFVQDEASDVFIDGGLDYTRSNRPTNAYMVVREGKEIFYANSPARSDQIGTDRPS